MLDDDAAKASQKGLGLTATAAGSPDMQSDTEASTLQGFSLLLKGSSIPSATTPRAKALTKY